MTKVKMCLQCDRLVNLDTIECSCGSKDFTEVILDFVEKEKDRQSTVQSTVQYSTKWQNEQDVT